ncbi:hypothetical protein [Colwellia psychrerythraea]|uniref:Uncharacterized protein n=1 Tax=Colwellia psychrerythraea TaxID=28229 RepID=A0A099KGJ7_COLPS|nr:hypothetical protein [Colwellia psychrerythraea]KGJ89919.1 hypothetical protein GAB14E_3797 [Colwellia psychrerythraea]
MLYKIIKAERINTTTIDTGWIKAWEGYLEPVLAKMKTEQQFGQMMGA